MESKTLIVSVLVIMSLFMAQIQVDARLCCPNRYARNIYNNCFSSGLFSISECTVISDCIIKSTCPPGYTNAILENKVNEYCKLGCVSSVCGALTTLHNSDASEIVNGRIEKCEKVCSTICSKNSKNKVETA